MNSWLKNWLRCRLTVSTSDCLGILGGASLAVTALAGSTAVAFESTVSSKLQVSDPLISNLPVFNWSEAIKENKKRRRTKADGARSQQSSQQSRRWEALFVPPGAGAPKSTANSATRSSGRCLADEADIQALIPPQGYGLSASDRPTITLNLPASSAQQVALVFRSESGDSEQLAWLPVPQSAHSADLPEAAVTSAFVPFQLPIANPGLTPGQRYRWSLVLVCGETVEPDDPTFEGWVEYQPLTAAQQAALAELSTEEKQRWYGARGYWYDMIQP